MDPLKPNRPLPSRPAAPDNTPTPTRTGFSQQATTQAEPQRPGQQGAQAVSPAEPAALHPDAVAAANDRGTSAVQQAMVGWHNLPPDLQRHIVGLTAPASAAHLLLTNRQILQLTQSKFTQVRLQLAIATCSTSEQVMALFSRPGPTDVFSQVRALNLSRKRLTAVNLAEICRLCTGIEELNVTGNVLGSSVSTFLGACPPCVRSLNLCDTYLEDAGVAAVAQATNLFELRGLNLASNNMSAIGARALEAATSLGGLRHLDLSNNDLEWSGAQAIANAPKLSLASLDLGRNDIADAGVEALAISPQAAILTHLGLSKNHITVVGARSLARSPYLSGLQELEISENDLRDDGLATLAQSAGLSGILSLQVHDNAVGDAGVRALARNLTLAALTDLGLGFNRIRNSGADSIASSSRLTALTSLTLLNNQIRFAGANALARSHNLPALTSLDLSDNDLQEHQKTVLREIASNKGWRLDL